MANLFDLNKKIAVVTGGLGQLGQHFAAALVEAGARVAVIDVTVTPRSSLKQFAAGLKAGKIKIYQADITQRQQLEQTLTAIVKDLGEPSILVNNAALDSPPNAPASENGPFETYPESSLSKIIDVNLKGLFICCQVFGGRMAANGDGSIINIGSIYGLVSPNQDIYEFKRQDGAEWYKPAPYAMTKSGVYNLTRYLATYWAKKGVRVNTLSPAGIANDQAEAFLKEYQKRIPIGRMAKAEEMTGPLVFLASPAASYMTGANLVVDGGWTAW